MSSNAELRKWLVERNVCPEALEWLGDRDLAAAWQECAVPEWMLWLLGYAGISRSTMRLLACRLVRATPITDGRTVWDLLDQRSRAAVEVAERHARRGEATDTELAADWTAAARAAWADAARAARASDAAKVAQCRIIREMISLHDIESAMEAQR